MTREAFPTLATAAPLQTPGPEAGIGELLTLWPDLVRVGWFLLGVLAVLLLGRLLVQPFLARVLSQRNRNNPTLQAAVVLYFRLVLVLVAVLVGSVVAGYGGFLSDSAIVISAVALAVGIAAQEVIGSLASGVALVLDREFNVGDYIRWEGGEGVVKSIALRVTRVETLDGELVTIPNTILTGNEITRPYGRGNHRIVQELGIAYEDDISEVLAQLEAVAATTDGILAEPPPTAYVEELGEEITIRVYYWVHDPNRRQVFATRSAYARAAKERLQREGITISPITGLEVEGRITVDEPT